MDNNGMKAVYVPYVRLQPPAAAESEPHIVLSCIKTQRVLRILNKFNPAEIHVEKHEPATPPYVSFSSYEKFKDGLSEILYCWKIPYSCHHMIRAQIFPEIGQFLKTKKIPSGFGIHLYTFYVQDLSLFLGWIIHQERERVEGARAGMTPSSLASMMSLKRERFEGGDLMCSICWEEFSEGAILSSMPCKHSFHDKCIKRWLYKCNSCPLCRFKMPEEDDISNKEACRFIGFLVTACELAKLIC